MTPTKVRILFRQEAPSGSLRDRDEEDVEMATLHKALIAFFVLLAAISLVWALMGNPEAWWTFASAISMLALIAISVRAGQRE